MNHDFKCKLWAALVVEEENLHGERILIKFDEEAKEKKVELIETEDYSNKKSKSVKSCVQI